MSNVVDMLCVGGPANGRMLCIPRVNMTLNYGVPMEGFADVVTYARREWQHPMDGKLYWIATRDEDNVTDSDIIVEVALKDFQPAWDLNRAIPLPTA